MTTQPPVFKFKGIDSGGPTRTDELLRALLEEVRALRRDLRAGDERTAKHRASAKAAH